MDRARWLSSSQVSSWIGTGDVKVPSRQKTGVYLPLDTVNYQGLIYFLGTNRYSSGFVNPSGISVATSLSSQLDVRSGSYATDRASGAALSSHTQNTVSSWWKIDIGLNNTSRRIEPTNLAIRQRQDDPSHLHQSLSIDGSNNDSSWTQIGSVSDGGLAESQGAWNIISLSNSPVRYIRITQTGVNTTGANYFTVGEVEIFGTVSE